MTAIIIAPTTSISPATGTTKRRVAVKPICSRSPATFFAIAPLYPAVVNERLTSRRKATFSEVS